MDKVFGNWRVIGDELGSGGQGRVFVVRRKDEDGPAEKMVRALRGVIPGSNKEDKIQNRAIELEAALREFIDGTSNCGALKQLIESSSEEAKARLQTEVTVYESISDPHLLKVLDKNLPERWIVTEFQPNGTLEKRLSDFKGDVLRTLKSIRPVVKVLAEMHLKGFTHRDFKPGNIFIGRAGQLVLGDAGLAFYANDRDTRLTRTYENVGTRDYMPAWAMSRRAEIRPSFDVFSVGKVLWAMIAGVPTCPLWYVHRPEYELEELFPDDPKIKWMRSILDGAVVEDEPQCLPNAGKLLEIIDSVVTAASRGGQPIGRNIIRLCTVCGVGSYKAVSEPVISENIRSEINKRQQFGLNPTGGTRHLIYSCDHCGHV